MIVFEAMRTRLWCVSDTSPCQGYRSVSPESTALFHTISVLKTTVLWYFLKKNKINHHIKRNRLSTYTKHFLSTFPVYLFLCIFHSYNTFLTEVILHTNHNRITASGNNMNQHIPGERQSIIIVPVFLNTWEYHMWIRYAHEYTENINWCTLSQNLAFKIVKVVMCDVEFG